jgi:hypothetical protein
MRELLLADQSGVGPEINDDNFAFEIADRLSQVVVFGHAEFDFGLIRFVRSDQRESERGQRQELPSQRTVHPTHDVILSHIELSDFDQQDPATLVYIVMQSRPAREPRFTVAA